MARLIAFTLIALAVLSCSSWSQNQPPASDPQALAYASQSITALTGGTTVSDATLTGSVTWIAGSDVEAGTATLLASGTGESRVSLALANGSRTETRDVSTGSAEGQWTAQGGTSGLFAQQNCWTDAVWFFPTLSSLSAGANVVLSYVGQETRNGESVQHLQSYVYQSYAYPGPGPTPQQLSTMDFYLDAGTLLPSAITYSAHPDNDATTNISVEVDFSNYQPISGVNVAMHIQKYVQGTLTVDLMLSGASFNTGLPISDFAIN